MYARSCPQWPACEDRVLDGPASEDQGPYASYPEYSRANSYPWSPFPPRRAHPGPGPYTAEQARGKERAERRGNTLTGFPDFRIENGSSQGQNLALTGLCVSSSRDSGRGH